MKIKTLFAISTLAAASLLCSCNQQIIDFELMFTKALVRWPDGRIEIIDVKKWNDYEGEQLQIIDNTGNVYVFNSMNVVLMNERGTPRFIKRDESKSQSQAEPVNQGKEAVKWINY